MSVTSSPFFWVTSEGLIEFMDGYEELDFSFILFFITFLVSVLLVSLHLFSSFSLLWILFVQIF